MACGSGVEALAVRGRLAAAAPGSLGTWRSRRPTWCYRWVRCLIAPRTRDQHCSQPGHFLRDRLRPRSSLTCLQRVQELVEALLELVLGRERLSGVVSGGGKLRVILRGEREERG